METEKKPKKPAPTVARPIYFLDLDGVAAATTLSPAGVQRLVREGGFPKPRLISARRVAWLASEVDAWSQSRPVSELPPPDVHRAA